MHISIYLGPFARGPAEDLPLIDLCLEQAIAAADAGFAMISFGEQHFNNYEPYCNPFMMGARLAPYLKQSYFGVSVCPIVFHHPIRLAENINVLDNLVRGRLIVGMSAGRLDFSPDFENFDLNVRDRRAIFEAKLDFAIVFEFHSVGSKLRQKIAVHINVILGIEGVNQRIDQFPRGVRAEFHTNHGKPPSRR